jgi:subtilisin family serine protease
MKNRKPSALKSKISTTSATPSETAGPESAVAPKKFAHIPAHKHPIEKQKNVPGQLVVRIKEDVTEGLSNVMSASLNDLTSLSLPAAVDSPFKKLQELGLIREVKPIFSRMTGGEALSVAPTNVAAAFAMSVHDAEEDDLRGITLLRLARATDLNEVQNELNNTPGIEYVHSVPRRWITARAQPNDPLFDQQWGISAIRWLNPSALPDASAVKVGVLDTGVDLTHRDLKKVIRSYNHEGASQEDIIGHGTHVSGIIAADMNNKFGLSGLCRCDLNFWKVFSDTPDPDDGEFYVDEVMYQRALNAARKSGMRVLNLSIGGGDPSQTERMLFRRLIEAGVTVIAAMGNEFEQGNPIEFPGA